LQLQLLSFCPERFCHYLMFSVRWASLQAGVETRLDKLRDAMHNFGPQSQLLLNGLLPQFVYTYVYVLVALNP